MIKSTTQYERELREYADLVSKLNEDARKTKEILSDRDKVLDQLISDVVLLCKLCDVSIEERLYSSPDRTADDFRRVVKEVVDPIKNKIIMAHNFEFMLNSCNENEMVKDSWDNFVMTLRLCGFDKK